MTHFTQLLAEYRSIVADNTPEAARAYWLNHGNLDADHFADSFCGVFDWESEVDIYLVDTWYDFSTVPENVAQYVDDERVARDMRFDYSTIAHNDKVYLFHAC